MGSEYKSIPIEAPSRPPSDLGAGGTGPSEGMGVALVVEGGFGIVGRVVPSPLPLRPR